MNIYQAIWNADQTGSGIRPVLATSGDQLDESHGYVRVITRTESMRDPNILYDAVIPPHKAYTYDLVRRMFNNYALAERDPENETPEERAEIHDLLAAVVDSEPMMVARQYVEEVTGTAVSSDRWYATLLEMWFRRFSEGGDPALSGFEHVFVGEQQGAKAQGYHFWYKYYLDDGMLDEDEEPAFPGWKSDRIVYLRGAYKNGQEEYPESVTISYKWLAPDYDRKKLRPLTKPTGGFFVGCSVEGLMAMGSVRAHLGARAPKEAVINGARYDLKVFHSPNRQHVRTFYPMFLGAAAQVPDATGGRLPFSVLEQVAGSKLRILAALVNPVGGDQGAERVIVANGARSDLSLAGFVLRDANQRRYELQDFLVPAGGSVTLDLPLSSIALSNKGGEITLLTPDGKVAHRVSYSRRQAEREGELIVF
jgi:poly(U)-specific endoribonuclease